MSLREQRVVEDPRREYLTIPGAHRVRIQTHSETSVGRAPMVSVPAIVIDYIGLEGKIAGQEYRLVFVQPQRVNPRQNIDDIRRELKKCSRTQEAYLAIEQRGRYIHTSFFAEKP